jgi:LPS-assembly protein
MINNFYSSLIISILLSLINFNAFGQDQFNFDITEVEILESGNIYKGYKRGTITTDNGLSIDADRFNYNKTLNILDTYGDVLIYDKIKDSSIFTQKATYLKNEEKIFTDGESKASDKNGITITADQLKYDKIQNIVNAYGNVIITNPLKDYTIYTEEATYLKNEEKIFSRGITKAIVKSKYIIDSKDVVYLVNDNDLSSEKDTIINDQKANLYYLERFNFNINNEILKGDNVKVITNFNLEQSDQMYFSNAIINLKDKNFTAGNTEIRADKKLFDDVNNDPRIKGVSSEGKGNRTTIKKGVFTSCSDNPKCSPWHIKAQKIVHDKEKKQLIYDNAILKVYNVPVLYFPKFFHPDPTVERQSGFLRPQLNDSSVLGSSLYVPYFQVLSENKDITWRPTVFNVMGLSSDSTSATDDKIYMLQTEYRQENEYSSFITDVGIMHGYKSQLAIDDKNTQTHFFAKFAKDLNYDNFLTSTLNASLYKVNNDSYLKIFDSSLSQTPLNPSNKNIMSSQVSLVLDSNDYNFDMGVKAQENLKNKKNSDRYSYQFPYYNFSKDIYIDPLPGIFNFDSDGNNNLRDTNIFSTSINNNLNFQSNSYRSKNGFSNNFKAYYSNTNVIAKKHPTYKNSPTVRFDNIYEFVSSWPLSNKTLNFDNLIVPKVSYRINPNGMDDMSGSSRRIDASNIFNINRLSTAGTFEDGQSLTLGINYSKTNLQKTNQKFDYSLATVLRNKKSNKIPESSTINETKSNIFGSFKNKFSDNFSIDYNVAVDNNFKKAPYNSVKTRFSINNFVTEFNFVEDNSSATDTNILSNTTSFLFNDNNSFSFKTRRNRKINLTEYYDLIYEYKNDCLVAGIKFRKTYYEDRELKPKEDLLFTLTLVPLTTYEHKADNWDFK